MNLYNLLVTISAYEYIQTLRYAFMLLLSWLLLLLLLLLLLKCVGLLLVV